MKVEPNERPRQGAKALSRIQSAIAQVMGAALLILPLSPWLGAVGTTSSSPGLFESFSAMDAYVLLALVSIVLFVALNHLFTLAETAVELIRTGHVRSEQDPKVQARLEDALANKARYVAACTMGSQTMRWWVMLLSIVPALSVARALQQSYPETAAPVLLLVAVAIVTIPIAAFNLIFGELVPKTYATVNPGIVAKLHGFLRVFAAIFSVPTSVITWIASLVTTRFGASATFTLANQFEEEIKSIAESASESGQIESDEKELLHSVFEFTDTVAREVMTPRVDMDAVSVETDPREVIDLIAKSGHSRIPVFENSDDEIIGVVHAKDLLMAALSEGETPPLRAFIRPAHFVPENRNLHHLLSDMRSQRTQLAIVQDEYGGTAGIVTVEDIVEELVGDIVDEYDQETPAIVVNGTGWIIEGRTHLDDVNEEIGTAFDSEEFDTIGGYVFGLFGRQPRESESVEDQVYRFTVTETDGRRIHRVHVEALPKESAEAGAQAEVG